MSLHPLRRITAWVLSLTAAALVALLLPARPASAHSLDEYLLASYLTLGSGQVGLQLDLSPGVLAVPAVLPQIDRNGDQELNDDEGRAYATQVLAQLQLSVDAQPLTLTLDDVEVPAYITMQAGYGTLRVTATATGAPSTAGAHELAFHNGFTPDRARYQVNAYLDKTGAVTLGQQRRDANQQQTSISYQYDPATAGTTAGTPAGTQTITEGTKPAGGRLAGYLQGSLSPGVVLVALMSAALLGALHALTPGHAKTLMAAYLVGNGGTARNAVTLGAVVTFTHTASVVVIGIVALAASQLLVPGVLVPALEITAGLLVLVLGLRLIRQRWSSRIPNVPVRDRVLVPAGSTQEGHDQTHGHRHDHAHDHADGHDPVHEHGSRAHTHAVPEGGVTARSLIAMGVSGGLVPCPEALGVMVLAVGVNRTVLGLGMIVSFSLGLAAVLIGLGLLLVRSRSLLARADRLDPRWTTALPILSAVVVTLLGLGLVLKGTGIGAGLPL